MKKWIFLLFALSGVLQAHAGVLSFDRQRIEFGERYQFSELRCDVRVTNNSKQDVSLASSKANAPGTVLYFDQARLAAGASTLVHIKSDLADRAGGISIRVNLETLESGKQEQYQIVLAGYVESILDDPKPALDLGTVDENGREPDKGLALTSDEDPQLRITGVLQKPALVDARVDSDGHTLLIRPIDFHELGYHKVLIKVGLSSPLQAQASVVVSMDLHGNVIPDQNPIDFGLQRKGSRKPVRLQLVSKSHKPFRVGKIGTDETSQIGVEPVPCLPVATEGCRAYMLEIKDAQKFGRVTGGIDFELPDTKQVIHESLSGVYLGDSTPVRSLNEIFETQKHSVGTQDVDLSTAIKSAVEEPAPAPAGNGPLLKWQVANEAGIYGYAIYRGNSANSHFARVNEQIVRAKNGGDNVTSAYQWRDPGATSGKEYWYYISIFYNNGKKVQLTGPQKVAAK